MSSPHNDAARREEALRLALDASRAQVAEFNLQVLFLWFRIRPCVACLPALVFLALPVIRLHCMPNSTAR